MNRKMLWGGALLVLLAVSGTAAYVVFYPQGPCKPTRASVSVSQLTPSGFGAVTEYPLPSTSGSSPWANAITVAADGTVWFGEQGKPGVASFNPSTEKLTEYLWPCYPSSNVGPLASIWGVANWNGGVWATDGDANRLVGLNPSDGSVTYVNTTSAVFPYLLSPAPDGSLWFTSLTSPAKLGRLGTDMSLNVYAVQGLGHEEPIQMHFVNSTTAYLVALNPYNDTDSGLYSFNPVVEGNTLTAHRVGGGFRLMFPQALDVSGPVVWVAQHLPSNIISFDASTGNWTTYPTSLVSYESTTLPYFVQVEGGRVWFNEHYGNRMAYLSVEAGTLTEYSESNPPVTNGSQIQNDLTFAATPSGAWFTSTTGNYIGFVNGSAEPGLTIATLGSNQVRLFPGMRATVGLRVSGNWGSGLTVRFSDSENYTSIPYRIGINASVQSIPAGHGPADFTVSLVGRPGLPAGTYTVAVTVSDGVLSQTAYIFVDVP